MVSICLILIAVCVAYIGYVMYRTPIPDLVQEPMKLRLALTINDLVVKFVAVLDYLGIIKDYECLRWLSERMASHVVDGVDLLDASFDGIPVRMYTPRIHSGAADKQLTKGMVYYHGGGWVMGSINVYNRLAGYFATEGNMVVVSIGYRLNPEHSMGEGLDDCVQATEYFIKHADMFGVDPERIIISGDSAGGNYAAAVALRLRDQKVHPMPRIQLLIVPVVQAVDFQTPSFQQNRHGPFLTTRFMNWFYSYVYSKNKEFMPYFDTNTHVPGDVRIAMANGVLNHEIIPNENKYPPYEKPDFNISESTIWNQIKDGIMDPYSFPLMGNDHSNLPEAYIFTAQFDILRDDGYFYAHKLKSDGVKVTHHNCRFGWHSMPGFMSMPDVRHEFDRIVMYLNENV